MKENFPISLKTKKEADTINEKVDNYYDRPRTNKDRPAGEVADEIIKEASYRINLFNLPEKEREWYRTMQNAGINLLSDGFLEISRWDKTGKNFNNPKLISQKNKDLDSAIRMQDHILEKYRSDKEDTLSQFSKIENIHEAIDQINEMLNEWSQLEPKNKEQMQIQIANMILQLENCRNIFLVTVKEKLEAIVSLEDSKKRKNPGAFAARTVSAMNNLVKRINEMQLILPYIAARRELLVLEKRRIEKINDNAIEHLEDFLKHIIFKDTFKKSSLPNLPSNEIEKLKIKLGRVLHLLDLIHISPYFEQAKQAKFFINSKAKKYFSSKNNFVENFASIQAGAKEALDILKSDREQVGPH